MMKTAQQRFNEYMAASRQVSDAIRNMSDRTFESHGKSYAYAAGALSTIATDAIMQLPKAKRAEFLKLIEGLQ